MLEFSNDKGLSLTETIKELSTNTKGELTIPYEIQV